jgi:hypothetical protein
LVALPLRLREARDFPDWVKSKAWYFQLILLPCLVGGSRETLEGADTANGKQRVWLRLGGTMKASIRIAMLLTLTVCGTIASSAQEPKPAMDQSTPAAAAAADDNMTPYRKLAADTLTAFKAADMPTAKKESP